MGYQVEEKESMEQFRVCVIHSDGTIGFEWCLAYTLEEAKQKLIDIGFYIV